MEAPCELRGNVHDTFSLAMPSDSSGNVYIGGSFTNVQGIPAGYIARWDPSANSGTGAWSTLGTGLDNSVSALALGSSGNLYAGVQFTTAVACNSGLMTE